MKKNLPGLLLLCCFHYSFSQSGQLDPSFGTKGIIKKNMGAVSSYNNTARQVLVKSDGTMFMVLDGTIISKRLPNGSVDSTYGFNGYSRSVSLSGAYAALQPDGKILIAGSVVNGSTSFILARLTANGMPDTSFGNKGIQITNFGDNSYASSVAVQPDGKIVLAGSITSFFGVARYTANGIPDSTFNGTGNVVTDFGSDLQYANAVAIQADGKIVIGGTASVPTEVDFAIARYKTNGTLDSTFGVQGRQTTKVSAATANGNSLALQPDGKIILAGYASDDGISNYFAVVRYTTAGAPDNAFNGNGIQTVALGGSDMLLGNSVALQGDGKVVIAGYTLNGDHTDFAVARFNTNGSADNSFGSNGILTTDINSTDDYAGSIAIQTDNKIVVAGYAANADTTGFALARYNSNGTLDNSFGNGGKLTGDYNQGYTRFNATAVQADGKIVAAGRAWNGTDYDFAVARFNSNGSVDSTFNANGNQLTNFGTADEAVSILIQPDGKIIVAGNSDNQFAIARYNANGTVDNTFSSDGKLTLSIGFSDVCQSAALQADGKILLAGYTFTDSNYDSAFFAITRINSTGLTDLTFNGNGKQLTEFDLSPSYGAAIAVQTDGKIVMAGRSIQNNQNVFSLARYKTDGSLDNAFSQDGQQESVFGPDGYEPTSLAIQNDGKIIVAGFSEDISGINTSFVVARYLTDGAIDNSFSGDGFQTSDLGDHFNIARSVAINFDGRIALGGTNDNYAVVLYRNDGSPDSSFGLNGVQVTNVGVSGSSVRSLVFANGKLYTAGNAQFPGAFGVVARYLLPEAAPLAVTLTDFTATLQNKTTLLKWQTTRQEDLIGFIIERSAAGNDFLPIGYQASKTAGNSKIDYSITDSKPLSGVNFYRLKMMDNTGKFTYSKTVAVTLGDDFTMEIFPNPVSNVIFIRRHNITENATLQIIDAGGRILKELKTVLNINTPYPVYVSALPGGVYTLKVITNAKTETRRFIKN